MRITFHVTMISGFCQQVLLIDLQSTVINAYHISRSIKGKLTQDYVPSSVIKYPLEIHQLQNPKFEIVRVRENKSLEIKAAFIQLEISKQCSDLVNV